MKIAIFVDTFYPNLGGMEDATAALAQALGAQGHEVIVFAPHFPLRDFYRRGLSVRELDLGDHVKIKRLFSIPLWGKIPGRMVIPIGVGYYQLRKELPDLVHTQSIFGAGLEALLAISLLKINLIGTNHSIFSEFAVYSPIMKKTFAKLAGRYESWFYNHCCFVSTASQAVFFALKQNGFNRSHQIISNIVDTDNFTPALEFPNNSLEIAYAGRFAIEKRGEVVLQSLSLVKNKIPAVKLVFAGAGPEEGNWKKIIKTLGLDNNVEFVGSLSKIQLAKLFRRIKVFVIASAIENQSMVTLQAMACGLPVVGVNGRGMPEIVRDGQNGFIVPIDDFPQMAEKIVELLLNSKLASDLGKNGRRLVENCTAKNIARKWEEIYQTSLVKDKK